jgi:hypothetical protein
MSAYRTTTEGESSAGTHEQQLEELGFEITFEERD